MKLNEFKKYIPNILLGLNVTPNLVSNNIFKDNIIPEILKLITLTIPSYIDEKNIEVYLEGIEIFFSINTKEEHKEDKSFFEINIIDNNHIRIRQIIYKERTHREKIMYKEAHEYHILYIDNKIELKINESRANNEFDSEGYEYEYSEGHQKTIHYIYYLNNPDKVKAYTDYYDINYQKNVKDLTFNDMFFKKIDNKNNAENFKLLK